MRGRPLSGRGRTSKSKKDPVKSFTKEWECGRLEVENVYGRGKEHGTVNPRHRGGTAPDRRRGPSQV